MRTKRFIVASLAVYTLIGVATTMLGPLLPSLARQWKLTDSQSGLLFVAQFCGGFLGAVASTKLIRGISVHLTIRAGLLMTAVGVACVPSASLWIAVTGIAIYGTGIGFATPSISVAICEVLSNHQARALNLLNFFWAIGAIVAPGMISRLLLRGGLGLQETLTIASALLVAAAFVIPRVQVTGTVRGPSVKIDRNDLRLILITGLLIFIYVGIENGVAGWLPTFAQRLEGFTPESGALLQGAFWAALLTGRFLSAVWLRPGREHPLITTAITLVITGTASLLLNHDHKFLYVSVVMLGLGCAPMFPTTVAVLSQQLSATARERLGWMFAAGGLGGAALPYCIGVLSTATSSLRFGMCILQLAGLGMLATHIVMRHYSSAPLAQESSPQLARSKSLSL